MISSAAVGRSQPPAEGPTLSGAKLDTALIDKARSLRTSVAELLATAPERADATVDRAAAHISRAAVRDIVLDLLDREARLAHGHGRDPGPTLDERVFVELVIAMLFGLGLLQVFIDDESVENIDVNGADTAFVTFANGEKLCFGPIAESDDELVAMVRSAAARFGLSERRFDAAQPELDLRLPDGSRLSAVMAVTPRPVIDIRRHRLSDHSLDDLVGLGTLDDDLARMLASAVRAKRNILISGAMNSGKTTLLRALAAEISPSERIVTIEQALELGLDRQVERHPDSVAMEARLANTEGVGAIGMAQLVRRSLRMNASPRHRRRGARRRGHSHAERDEPGTVGLNGNDSRGRLGRCLPTSRLLCDSGSRTPPPRGDQPPHRRRDSPSRPP